MTQNTTSHTIKKIVFMGSPDFAIPALQALIDSPSYEVVGVFSQPPRPSGRGQKETKTLIHQLASDNEITVYTPQKLDTEAQEILLKLSPEIIVVAAYGLLLPQAVLDIAPCINIHPSALPRWRGAAPLNHTILAGDSTTDVCIMEMEAGLDSGPVYTRQSYDIKSDETAGELHDRLANEGANLLIQTLDNFANITPQVQSEEGVTYAHKFKSENLKAIRKLDFSKSAQEIHNQIRGLSPWPCATLNHNQEAIKVLKSSLANQKDNTSNSQQSEKAGTVIAIENTGITIACGTEDITLTELQRAGKRPLPIAEFIKGYEIKIGDIVS